MEGGKTKGTAAAQENKGSGASLSFSEVPLLYLIRHRLKLSHQHLPSSSTASFSFHVDTMASRVTGGLASVIPFLVVATNPSAPIPISPPA